MSVTTNASEAVERIVDLLDDAAPSVWTNATPRVQAMWETSQQGRQHYKDPAVYVWSPVDSEFNLLSGFDADRNRDRSTVEVQCWTLDETESATLASDVVNELFAYANDNEAFTNAHRIRPQSAADNRAQSQARLTNHFVYNVTIDLRFLRDV